MSYSSGSTCSRSELHSLGQVTWALASSFSNLSYSWLLSVTGYGWNSPVRSVKKSDRIDRRSSSPSLLRFLRRLGLPTLPRAATSTSSFRTCEAAPPVHPFPSPGSFFPRFPSTVHRATYLCSEAPGVSAIPAPSERLEGVPGSSGAHGVFCRSPPPRVSVEGPSNRLAFDVARLAKLVLWSDSAHEPMGKTRKVTVLDSLLWVGIPFPRVGSEGGFPCRPEGRPGSKGKGERGRDRIG